MRWLTLTATFVVGLLLGWASVISMTHLSYPHLSVPDSSLSPYFFSPKGTVQAKPAPSDFLDQSTIHVYDTRVVIDGDYTWATFTPTNSMSPVLNENTHTLQKMPLDPSELQEGDIIAYSINNQQYPIIHRIVEIGTDNTGWYAITQGDNLEQPDPEKVRFNQIVGVVVAILY